MQPRSSAASGPDREPGAVDAGARVCRALFADWAAVDPPEKLLRAMLLHAFYLIRSERLLMERLEYDLPFRWFVGILEGSNRSRDTDLAGSRVRDLFEAGLNEDASCERRPIGARD